MSTPGMQPPPTRGARWRRFAVIVVTMVVVQQLAGYLLFGDPLLTRLVPALVAGIVVGWVFSFGWPRRRV